MLQIWHRLLFFLFVLLLRTSERKKLKIVLIHKRRNFWNYKWFDFGIQSRSKVLSGTIMIKYILLFVTGFLIIFAISQTFPIWSASVYLRNQCWMLSSYIDFECKMFIFVYFRVTRRPFPFLFFCWYQMTWIYFKRTNRNSYKNNIKIDSCLKYDIFKLN